MKRILLVLPFLVLLGGVGVARAQAPDATGYHSPFRDSWRDEVQKDPVLKGDIEEALRYKIHEDESATFTRNNEHVVMAYIAIWVLTAGFVLVTFLRQGKLKGEIARLQADLTRALKDDK